MIANRLAIPLTENPARQKLWRAVSFLLMLGIALGLGLIIEHALNFRTSNRAWPANANLAINLSKTPRTVELVNQKLANVQALPHGPWSLAQVLSTSNRGLTLYFNDDELVGLSFTGQLDPAMQSELAVWGYRVGTDGHRYLIEPDNSPAPVIIDRGASFFGFMPNMHGSISHIDSAGKLKTAPIRITKSLAMDIWLDMSSFEPSNQPLLDSETELLAFVAVTPDLAQRFLSTTASASFPGLQLLINLAVAGGFELSLGQDKDGLALAATTNPGSLSLEDLGAIAQESLALQSLSTLEYTNEILSQGVITLDISTNSGINAAVASNETGQTFRLSTSSEQLLISNRPVRIGLASAKISSDCLARPIGFIKPIRLLDWLIGQTSETASINNGLQNANEIAYTKNRLRICW